MYICRTEYFLVSEIIIVIIYMYYSYTFDVHNIYIYSLDPLFFPLINRTR